MSIASLSFSAALPVYNSIGANGTIFGNSSVAVKGDVAINTNGAPASSGQATFLASDLTSNGLSYSATGAQVNGNQVTVYYNLAGNNDADAATDESARQTLSAGDQGVALNSGLYGTGLTITPEGSQTNGTKTTTAYEIALNGPANNTYGTINQQLGYSVSDSGDGSSLSISGISSLGNGLKVTYQLSDATPAGTTQPPAGSPTASDTGNTGLPASLKGITTIGDLLASANGLSFNGTLAGALQAQSGGGQSTGNSNSASTLASVLNPGVSPSTSNSFQVTDFIDTSTSAFPTQGPPVSQNSSNNFSSQSNNSFGNNSSAAPNGDSTNNQGTSPAGVYTSFADSGASNIRGGNLNVVA